MARGWARGWRVGVVQFIKGGKWKTGERKLADHLGVEWHTLGDGFTWESTDLDETAAKGLHAWEVAASKLASGDYDLLILDELTYAVKYEWVPVDEVVAGIRDRAEGTNVVMTGRDAADELVELADTVTEMRKGKHAAERGSPASTAHVARLLDAPVVLVVDASAMSGSVAALVHGYTTFDESVRVVGVVLNRVGSPAHESMLREALASLGIPVLGVLARADDLAWRDRHLGLVPVVEQREAVEKSLERLADAVDASCDLDAISAVARAAPH